MDRGGGAEMPESKASNCSASKSSRAALAARDRHAAGWFAARDRAGGERSCGRTCQRQSSPFPRPAALEPNIDFWVKAFTYWSERDFVVHDRDNVSLIYQKFHMPGDGAPTGEEVEWANAYLKAKYGDILNRLATGQQPIGWEEQRVAAMFKGQPVSAYARAAQNLRVQQGLASSFMIRSCAAATTGPGWSRCSRGPGCRRSWSRWRQSNRDSRRVCARAPARWESGNSLVPPAASS